MGDYELKVDTSKNRLTLKVEGFIREDEVKIIINDISESVDKLKPGLNVISEITDFKPASPKVAGEILRFQKILKDKGLQKIIFISGSNVLAKKQFEKIGKQAGYDVGSASSIEEAEKMLDG